MRKRDILRVRKGVELRERCMNRTMDGSDLITYDIRYKGERVGYTKLLLSRDPREACQYGIFPTHLEKAGLREKERYAIGSHFYPRLEEGRSLTLPPRGSGLGSAVMAELIKKAKKHKAVAFAYLSTKPEMARIGRRFNFTGTPSGIFFRKLRK